MQVVMTPTKYFSSCLLTLFWELPLGQSVVPRSLKLQVIVYLKLYCQDFGGTVKPDSVTNAYTGTV